MYFILLIFTFFLTSSCTFSKNETLKSINTGVDSIVIVNKTDLDRYPKKIVTTDSHFIKDFLSESLLMNEVNVTNLRANRGFFDITIYFNDNQEKNLNVIFTIYDGVVIRNNENNKYYKYDKLFNVLSNYYFQKKLLLN